MTEQTAKKIERLLLRLLAVLEPAKPKPISGASVSVVTVERGQVRTDAASEDVPRQTVEDVVMTRLGKARRVVRIK